MSVMSLHPHPLEPVPEETARVARGAFPKGHPSLTFRDALGTIFQDEDFTALFPAWGQPGLPPWRLALVTIMPFRENLADRQAAEAVRAHRLEVSAASRADGPGFRLFGPERIARPSPGRQRRRTAAGEAVRAMPHAAALPPWLSRAVANVSKNAPLLPPPIRSCVGITASLRRGSTAAHTAVSLDVLVSPRRSSSS